MLKKISGICFGLSLIVAVVALYFTSLPKVVADDSGSTFQVNVKEVLTVSISAPTAVASGSTGDFLRNKVSLAVTSNSSGGFVAGMTSANVGATLTNTLKPTVSISTLSTATTRADFPVNKWGYSFDDTAAGDSASHYGIMAGSGSSTPITVFNSDGGTTKDIYFGAKTDSTLPSGTYVGTVLFTVVSGQKVLPVNPTPTPVDPSEDQTDIAIYHPDVGAEDGVTTYTTKTVSGNVVTTSTQVTSGDTTSEYAPPQGQIEKTYSSYENNITDNSSIATALVVTASIAAVTGIVFFAVAKRKKDDDDDEEQYS